MHYDFQQCIMLHIALGNNVARDISYARGMRDTITIDQMHVI